MSVEEGLVGMRKGISRSERKRERVMEVNMTKLHYTRMKTSQLAHRHA